MSTTQNTIECCPPFTPEKWHDQIFDWDRKPFIKSAVCTLFYMPLNFGGVIKRITALADNAGATNQEWLCLADHTSMWNMDIYLAIDRPVARANNVVIGGKFFSRVYEGSFSNTRKWIDDYKEQAKNRGLEVEKWYMWYTTCPKCAKKYGKNYVVVVGKIK